MDNLTLGMKSSSELAYEKFQIDRALGYIDQEQVDLLVMAAGDTAAEFFEDLISTYKGECEPRIEELAVSCEERNSADVRKHVHFIAGSSANIGLTRIAHICKAIEKQCDSGRLKAFDECYSLVEVECRKSIEALRQAIENA